MTDKDNIITIIRDESISNRERGDALVEYAHKYLNKFYFLETTETKASGQVHADGDLKVPKLKLILDGKIKGPCLNVNVPATELNKIRMQAAKLEMHGAILTPVISSDKKDIQLYITVLVDDLEEIIHGTI